MNFNSSLEKMREKIMLDLNKPRKETEMKNIIHFAFVTKNAEAVPNQLIQLLSNIVKKEVHSLNVPFREGFRNTNRFPHNNSNNNNEANWNKNQHVNGKRLYTNNSHPRTQTPKRPKINPKSNAYSRWEPPSLYSLITNSNSIQKNKRIKRLIEISNLNLKFLSFPKCKNLSVHNLSSRILSPLESRVIGLNYNFIPSMNRLQL